MRRAIARGRVFPQYFSTDRRYGRLSLKACALFPLMWANADDQGRLCGDPEEIKYSCCPNIDHITKADIPDILLDLHINSLLLIYQTPKLAAIQILDWWDVQKLQWAWPSDYPPPDGWHDRLRYKMTANEVYKSENWDEPYNPQVKRNAVSGEGITGSQVSEKSPSGEPTFPSPSSENKDEEERGRGNRRGRGNSPETTFGSQVSAKIGSGESPSGSTSLNPSPSPTSFDILLLDELTRCYKERWGRIKAADPEKIIPRALGPKDEAQLRDLARELYTAGGCPLDYTDQAFDEAVNAHKKHISYVRAILLDWLGIERVHPP